VQGVARDVTDRRVAEQALRESESRFRDLFENANDLIYTHDLAGNFTSLNRAGEIITGYAREEAMKMNISQVVAPEFLEAARLMTKRKLAGEPPVTYDVEIIAKQGHRVSLELNTRLIFQDDKPVGVQGIGRDVTARKHAEESLRRSARHDALTGLPNRGEFMNYLNQSIKRADGNDRARFAVLFLDLDRFKLVNDSLGHMIGDKMLMSIAERLTSCVRPGDIVARFGGDEFTILLNRTGDTSDVEHVAERLQRTITEPFKIDNYEVFTSASIGIVMSDSVKRAAEDYLRDADAAMYRAKESGRSRHEVFDRQMHVRNMNLLQIETDLRHALERDQLAVHYQPIVNLETGELKEFEALMRWEHPVHGLVAPNEFIAAAEETGLIIPMGRWILEESCRQLTAWQEKFRIPYSMSVNLSAKQLMHPSLTGQVREILVSTELDPRFLKLEVTESTIMEHSEALLSVLSELYALGISFSTDDFGTGYSSLSYLHRFPFERLKIDRSFVSKMEKDRKCAAIVKTILMLGENLNIEVVAEGIENETQLAMLRSFGCRIGQGFLFSKPLDARDAERLLERSLSPHSSYSIAPFFASKQIIEATKIQ
jgi:diguanylate cyclase (GGDEF)-like protein/PAS domain S-box-containing protein